jgi:hypothetical protein
MISWPASGPRTKGQPEHRAEGSWTPRRTPAGAPVASPASNGQGAPRAADQPGVLARSRA